MKTNPLRKATRDVLGAAAALTAVVALAALAVLPPWTWFGIGRPLVSIRVDPALWADVADTGWVGLLLLAVLWFRQFALHAGQNAAGTQAAPEEHPR